jgi:hypothetical protein
VYFTRPQTKGNIMNDEQLYGKRIIDERGVSHRVGGVVSTVRLPLARSRITGWGIIFDTLPKTKGAKL